MLDHTVQEYCWDLPIASEKLMRTFVQPNNLSHMETKPSPTKCRRWQRGENIEEFSADFASCKNAKSIEMENHSKLLFL